MGDGPISYVAIMEYCIVHQLDEEQRDDLIYHVRQMDKAYFKFMKDKRDREKGG